MKTRRTARVENEVIESLIYTCRLIETASIKPLRRIGLTPETAAVLYGVKSLNNKARPSEIAKRGARKPQTTTANIKKMVASGLLVKEPDERKKNSFTVSLSPKGQMAYEKTHQLYINRRITSSLSREELSNLKACVEKIEKDVKELLKNTQHLEVI
jgi:DNA-binding MarR family transcriptional regulator